MKLIEQQKYNTCKVTAVSYQNIILRNFGKIHDGIYREKMFERFTIYMNQYRHMYIHNRGLTGNSKW